MGHAEKLPQHLQLENDDEEEYEIVSPVIRLKHRATLRPIPDPVDYSSFVCGLLAGVAQAGIFNPYDRALYLSVKNHQPFLSWQNWKAPYSGFFQSISSRALAGGLYFPLEHFFLHLIDPDESRARYNFLAGTAAGAMNACVLNPLSAIKYKTWGRKQNRGMWTEATGMLQKSGSLRPFLNGLRSTIYRDVVFGGCYTWMRLQIQWWFQLQPQEQWMANLVAASLATIVSGPFNYVRNIQYSTRSSQRSPCTTQVLKDLVHKTKKISTSYQQLHFLQQRLRIGWGTARVAMGISFGHAVYDWLHVNIKRYY